mgnify:CR=1 FL=1
MRYATGTGTFRGAPTSTSTRCPGKGLTDSEIGRIEQALPSMLDIRFAFSRGMVTDDTLTRLGVSVAEREKPTFSALPFLGFTDEQIAEANSTICGSRHGRGRTRAFGPSTFRCSTAPTAAAPGARASSRRWATCA